MRVKAYDRRKWFAANFGRSYFKSQPLINPSALIGFALPCAVVLLVCAAALVGYSMDLQPELMAFGVFAGPVINLEKFRENRNKLLETAKQLLEAAEKAGGFTDETKKNYDEVLKQLKSVDELLGAAQNLPAETQAAGNGQIVHEVNLTHDESLIAAGEAKQLARVSAIYEVCAALKLRQSFAKEHIDKKTDIATFQNLAIAEKKRMEELDGATGIGTPASDPRLIDEADSRRFAMVGALLNRFEPNAWIADDRERTFSYDQKHSQKLFDGSKHYMGMSLLDVAKECLANVGIRWQTKSKQEIVRLAFHSTSDFPYILADSANKSLRAGYDLAPSQWRLIAARRTAADFKTAYELTLDGSTRLSQVKESGEFKRGVLTEGRESWVLKTYGEIIAITRQAIINDDLGAFTRVPMMLGQEVAMLEADTVWGVLTANAALADGQTLFEESTYHKNYISGAAAISVASIGAARKLMMVQKSSGGKPMGLVPRFLVAPAGVGTVAEQYCSPNFQAAQSSNVNPFAGKLEPIVEARLDATDVNDWYLFADPNTPNGTVLIYAYLEGQEGPYTETRQGFDVDGTEVKIRHDFAAAAVDYRGVVKTVGA